MAYWLSIPLAMFILSPLWTNGWGGTYVGDKFQMEEVWDEAGPGGDTGQVRTSEGMIGPPRN